MNLNNNSKPNGNEPQVQQYRQQMFSILDNQDAVNQSLFSKYVPIKEIKQEQNQRFPIASPFTNQSSQQNIYSEYFFGDHIVAEGFYSFNQKNYNDYILQARDQTQISRLFQQFEISIKSRDQGNNIINGVAGDIYFQKCIQMLFNLNNYQNHNEDYFGRIIYLIICSTPLGRNKIKKYIDINYSQIKNSIYKNINNSIRRYHQNIFPREDEYFNNDNACVVTPGVISFEKGYNYSNYIQSNPNDITFYNPNKTIEEVKIGTKIMLPRIPMQSFKYTFDSIKSILKYYVLIGIDYSLNYWIVQCKVPNTFTPHRIDQGSDILLNFQEQESNNDLLGQIKDTVFADFMDIDSQKQSKSKSQQKSEIIQPLHQNPNNLEGNYNIRIVVDQHIPTIIRISNTIIIQSNNTKVQVHNNQVVDQQGQILLSQYEVQHLGYQDEQLINLNSSTSYIINQNLDQQLHQIQQLLDQEVTLSPPSKTLQNQDLKLIIKGRSQTPKGKCTIGKKIQEKLNDEGTIPITEPTSRKRKAEKQLDSQMKKIIKKNDQ